MNGLTIDRFAPVDRWPIVGTFATGDACHRKMIVQLRVSATGSMWGTPGSTLDADRYVRAKCILVESSSETPH